MSCCLTIFLFKEPFSFQLLSLPVWEGPVTPLFPLLLYISWKGSNLSIPSTETPNPADGEPLQLVHRNLPKPPNSVILQAKSFRVPIPHPTNNSTSLLEKTSTEQAQPKCCRKSLFPAVCVNRIQVQYSPVCPGDPSLPSHPTAQVPCNRVSITHMVAPGTSVRASKKIQRPSLGGSAEKLMLISENRNSHQVGIKQPLKYSVGR